MNTNKNTKSSLAVSMLGLLMVCAIALAAKAAEPKEAIEAAAKALKEKGGYSWTTKTDIAGGQFTPAPVNGKTDKDGLTVITTEGQNGEMQAVRKGEKGVLKTEEGWKTAEEMAQGGGRGFFAGRLLSSPLPAAEIENWLKLSKEVKSGDGGLYTIAFTDDGAKELNTFGRGGRGGRGGQGGGAFPPPKDAKANAKVWIKDGVIAKYEMVRSAKITFGQDGEERDFGSTATTEISSVGSTKVEAPDEARKKL